MPRAGDRRRQPQAPTVAVLGDRLACLAPLREAPAVEVFRNIHTTSGRHRGVVIGVETAGLTGKKALRQLLRDVEVQCAVLCGRLPLLEQIAVVIDGPAGVSDDVLHRISDRAARRIAERLSDAYKELAVTAVLAEDCDDPALLARRLLERLRHRDPSVATITVPWEQIVTTPIAA